MRINNIKKKEEKLEAMGRKTVFDTISFKQVTESLSESEGDEKMTRDQLDLIDDPDLLTNREKLVKHAGHKDSDY